MPKYYFHVMDGKALLDGEGTNLADVAEAHQHALAIATSLLKGVPSAEGWSIFVADASRNIVVTCSFRVSDAKTKGQKFVMEQ